MASWADVEAVLGALPETIRDGNAWSVRGKSIAWDRPLRKNELVALGPDAPPPPILCVHTVTIDAKDELLTRRPDVCFTTPHFRTYPAVLVRLALIDTEELSDALVEAWIARAPRRVAAQWLAEHPDGP